VIWKRLDKGPNIRREREIKGGRGRQHKKPLKKEKDGAGKCKAGGVGFGTLAEVGGRKVEEGENSRGGARGGTGGGEVREGVFLNGR